MSLDLTHFCKSDGFLFTLEDIWSKAAGGLQHCLIRITFQFTVNNECRLLGTAVCWVGQRTSRTDLCPLRQKWQKMKKKKPTDFNEYSVSSSLSCSLLLHLFCHFSFSQKRLLCWAHSARDWTVSYSRARFTPRLRHSWSKSTTVIMQGHGATSREIKITVSTWLLLCCMNLNTADHILCLSARVCWAESEKSEVLVGSIFTKVAKKQVAGAPAALTALSSMLTSYHPGKSRGTVLYHNQGKRQSWKLQRHHCLPLDPFSQQGNHGSIWVGP